MKRFLLVIAAFAAAGPAVAQGPAYPRDPAATTGAITVQPNDTGGGEDATVSFGATGADTLSTNSAAGGNAARPEQAVPNGSGGGGSTGGNG